MKLSIVWIPILAIAAAACSSSPTSPSSSGNATGASVQAFSVADQPPIGNPAISRPGDAPTEFIVYENSGSTGLIAEWRKRENQVRWQWEITRHDPTDQPFSALITVDVRPAYEWIVPVALRGRAFNHRVRAAWPDGAVGAWTPIVVKGVGSQAQEVSAACWNPITGPRIGGAPVLPTCGSPLG